VRKKQIRVAQDYSGLASATLPWQKKTRISIYLVDSCKTVTKETNIPANAQTMSHASQN